MKSSLGSKEKFSEDFMKSIYVYQSGDPVLRNQKVQEIKAHYHIEDDAMSRYDLEENTLDQVLEDLDTYSFLSNKKCIIVTHPYFLVSGVGKEEDEAIQHLEKYLKNPNPDHILIIFAEEVDERRKIVKLLKETAQFEQLETNPLTLIKEELKGYELEPGAQALLLEFCNQDTAKLRQECEKLKLYALKSKKITKKDITMLVERELDQSDTFLFSFLNALITKDQQASFSKYRDLRALGYDAIAILGMLANQFRFLYQVKVLTKKNFKKEEIRKILDCHPYRIDKAKENGRYYSEEDLLRYIDRLATLDYQIKSGLIQAEDGLENFLLTT